MDTDCLALKDLISPRKIRTGIEDDSGQNDQKASTYPSKGVDQIWSLNDVSLLVYLIYLCNTSYEALATVRFS